MMKQIEKFVLGVLIIITIILVCAGFISLILWKAYSGKLFVSAGLLLALAGFVQLQVNGFFSQIMREYSDSGKQIPSYIVREIIDNPDRPMWTLLRNTIFINYYTGFYLIVCGMALQVIGIWL